MRRTCSGTVGLIAPTSSAKRAQSRSATRFATPSSVLLRASSP
jgi:hypothetical protein